MKVQHFLLTKNPGQKSWTKKGVFFLLDVPPSRAKNPGQEKRRGFFWLTKNPGPKKNEGETFFAYQKSWTKKRGELFFA